MLGYAGTAKINDCLVRREIIAEGIEFTLRTETGEAYADGRRVRECERKEVMVS